MIRRLFEMRNAADYSWLDAPAEPIRGDPIAEAQGFIDAVEAWIEERR